MNPKLAKVEAGIEENIKPEDRKAYDRIVTAGMKVIASDEFEDNLLKTFKSDDAALPDKVAEGIGRLITFLHAGSGGKMPIGPTIAASYTFVAKGLDIAERGFGAKITDEMIAETTAKTMSIVLPLLGITQGKLQQAMQGQVSPAGTTQQAMPPQPPGPSGAPPGGGMPQGLMQG